MVQLEKKRKIGLVLSGGGVKAAAFHMGVCRALEKMGIQFSGGSPSQALPESSRDKPSIDLYVGSSAGSVVCTMLASGYSVKSILKSFQKRQKWNNPLNTSCETNLKPLSYSDLFSVNGKNWFYFLPNLIKSRSVLSGSLETLLKNGFKINGVLTTKGLEKYIRQQVWPENTFSSLGAELYIVTTQLNHTRQVIFGNFKQNKEGKRILYANNAKISEAVAASSSLPPIFAPYGIKNKEGEEIFYFDGEIRYTLSTHVAEEQGCDLIISSYSIQPYHYNKEVGSLHEKGIPLILNQALYQVVQQKIESHINHNETIRGIYDKIKTEFEAHLSPTDLTNILQIIEEKAHFRPNTDYIYIHPDPQDYEMFFADHFNLNPTNLSRTVEKGFRAAINQLDKLSLD